MKKFLLILVVIVSGVFIIKVVFYYSDKQKDEECIAGFYTNLYFMMPGQPVKNVNGCKVYAVDAGTGKTIDSATVKVSGNYRVMPSGNGNPEYQFDKQMYTANNWKIVLNDGRLYLLSDIKTAMVEHYTMLSSVNFCEMVSIKADGKFTEGRSGFVFE